METFVDMYQKKYLSVKKKYQNIQKYKNIQNIYMYQIKCRKYHWINAAHNHCNLYIYLIFKYVS